MRGEWDCWVPDRSSGRYLRECGAWDGHRRLACASFGRLPMDQCTRLGADGAATMSWRGPSAGTWLEAPAAVVTEIIKSSPLWLAAAHPAQTWAVPRTTTSRRTCGASAPSGTRQSAAGSAPAKAAASSPLSGRLPGPVLPQQRAPAPAPAAGAAVRWRPRFLAAGAAATLQQTWQRRRGALRGRGSGWGAQSRGCGWEPRSRACCRRPPGVARQGESSGAALPQLHLYMLARLCRCQGGG